MLLSKGNFCERLDATWACHQSPYFYFLPAYTIVSLCIPVYACVCLRIPVYPCVYPCTHGVSLCIYLRIPAYSEFSWPFEFPYPVHGKFMVGFSIKFNGKTNHKLPVTGYGKFERPRNSLYTCVSLCIYAYTGVSLHIPVYTCACAHPVYTCVYLCVLVYTRCMPVFSMCIMCIIMCIPCVYLQGSI